MKKIDLSIIIPCFNEEKRLLARFPGAYKFFNDHFSSYELIFVNDGSSDQTEKILKKIASEVSHVKVVSYAINRGKGYAISQGVKSAQGEIVGYMDADFSISLQEVEPFISLIRSGVDIVIADRSDRESSIKNKPNILRRFLGNSLGLFNRVMLDLGSIQDSQCGFKFFKGNVAKKLFSTLTVYRWLFDMEILLKARSENLKIIKKPVLWEDVKNSKVSIFKDLPSVTKDLLKIYCHFFNLRIFLLLVTFVILVIFLPYIINPKSLVMRNGDFSDLVWPDYYFIRTSIYKFHQIPFWNPTIFGGIPEIANPESKILYLPNYLTLILPLELGIVVLLIGHLIFSAGFLFLFSKRALGFNNFAAIATSLSFTFSPFFWGKISVGHTSQLFATLLSPAILYYGYLLLEKFKFKYVLFLSILLGFQYLNHPTIWYYTNFFGVVLLFFLMLIGKPKIRLLRPIACAVLAVILISPIILIQFKTGPLITRTLINIDDLAIPVWSIQRFTKSIIIPSNFLSDNETESWLYPALTGLLFAALGFLAQPRRVKYFLGVVLLFVILITLGQRTPVFNLAAKYLPGFSLLRVSTRIWFVMVALISVLTGFGVKSLTGKKAYIAGLLLVVDLLIFSSIRLWALPDIMQYKPIVDLSTLLPSEGLSEYKIYCTKRCLSARETLPKGISTADGYHVLILRNYANVLSDAGGFSNPKYTGNLPTINDTDAEPNAEKIGELSVKWVVSDRKLKDSKLINIKKENGFLLYENLNAKPRVRFADGNGIPQLIEDTPNSIKIKTSREGTLIIADSFYPGWKGAIDGKPADLSEYNQWSRSINVPGGDHIVELRFSPFSLLIDK